MPCKSAHDEIDNNIITTSTESLLNGRAALSPKEFAALFGKSATWGYRQLYSGNIRRLAGCESILIPKSEIDRFLKQIVRHE